ncbi:hypothetical protein ACFPIJ_13435 [Dactylosporangium cerinum]|uniref:Aminoglycoside phosphotransferase domain-containing protein n=1 Tax=Dactylosporangium cerinum TaxID=1434730 RepID=A0ABV9VTL7_9ACTN
MLSIGHHRRFTANHTWHVNLPGHRLFLKLSPNPEEAIAERAGHEQLRGHYPVPVLRACLRAHRWTLLAYDRFGGEMPGQGLLLDEINYADLTGALTRLDHCLDDLLSHYQQVIAATAVRTRLADTTSKLYGDRASAGGRLDSYYRNGSHLLTFADHASVSAADLATTTLLVDGQPHNVDFERLITVLRCRFDPDRIEWAAITQGDPTDLNLGWTPEQGPVWFDFDTGGRNALAGEFACFLWYQHLHGGWLVPTYNPAAFVDHPAALQHRVLNRPSVQVRRESARVISIDRRHEPSAARRHTISRYVHELVTPTAIALGVDDIVGWLRPWLIMRLLAVYHLGRLTAEDAGLHLAYLTQILDPDTTLDGLFATTAPIGRSS